ncbi:MAG: ABC transporter substrate-binding protein [Armatimonadota bacterium]|nr:ABC transporter substrate-binding protein [Armatimonadota bacterium]MDR7439723.1 ABC transporter substrate-binding protein [Armatimonadota bacterium]MDR7563106.1 ABC transporter substrate-binding protein [Armatimonadota bacterium]MDR7600978.1 ABC transporter substrate-binding protein [Armatimonadota bacterium]
MRRLRWMLVGLFLLLAAGPSGTLAGPSVSDSVRLRELTTLRMVVIPGAQDFVINVMQKQGFDRRYNLVLDIRRVLQPQFADQAVAERLVDVGFMGLVGAVKARAEGKGVVIFNVLTGPSNLVLAPQTSPVRTLADLRGKKVGTFSGPGSATYAMLIAVARSVHGIDLEREAQLISAPNPALKGLMDRGELAAALFGTIDSVKVFLEGRYRVVSDLAEDFQKRFGRVAAHVVMATNEDYARRRPEVLRAFVAAYHDTMRYIDRERRVWVEYARELGFPSPEAAAVLLRQRVGSRFIRKWDEEQRRVQEQFIRILIEVLGPDRFVRDIPPGLMRLDLQPRP